jgi:hypothetical protein
VRRTCEHAGEVRGLGSNIPHSQHGKQQPVSPGMHGFQSYYATHIHFGALAAILMVVCIGGLTSIVYL